MPLTSEERDAIRLAALQRTREEFAGEVSKRTSLTTKEVLALGRTAAERNALAEVLGEVANVSTSNASKAAAIRNIAGGVEALVKLAALFV